MLVLNRTEVEDLFEYWVHRNKVLFLFFLNHNFDSHSFVLIDLVRPTARSTPLSFICKHKLIFVYLIASLD